MPSRQRRFLRQNRAPAIIGSGVRLNIDDREAVKRHTSRVQDWQTYCWDAYDMVGETKEAARFISNCLGRIIFYPAEKPDDPKDTPEQTTNPAVLAAWNRLGDHVKHQREFGKHAFVVGECWLVGLTPRPETGAIERWFIASTEEVKRSGGRIVKVETDWGGIEPRSEDFIARLWQRHPRKGLDADSCVRGVLSACDTLVTVDQTVRAILRQRAASGSIIALPDDVTVGDLDPTQEQGDASEDSVIDFVQRSFTTPTQNPGTAASVSPIIMTYPRNKADEKSGIEIHEINRPLDAMFDTISDRALKRLAQGISVSPERIFGLGQANHWGAGQIEESDYRDNVEPYAELYASDLFDAFLRPLIEDAGVADPDGFVIWFDASDLVIRGDRGEKSDYGQKNVLIKDSTWRADAGYTEDDAPDDEEIENRIRISQALAGRQPGEPEPEPDTAPPSQAPALAAAGSNGKRSVAKDRGRQLMLIDRTLRLRVQSASDAALERALEKTEARVVSTLRSDAQMRSMLRDAPPGTVVATAGVATLERYDLSVEDLLREHLQALEAKVAGLASRAWAQVGGIWKTSAPESSSDFVAAAAVHLTQQLRNLARDRMSSPAVAPDTPGERDPNHSVPAGLAREFVSRAGGGSPAITAARSMTMWGDWLVHGLATGREALDMAIQSGEAPPEENLWQWDYGQVDRALFGPHFDLDGVIFEGFQDPILANETEGWIPSEFFFPGDHDGCECDAVPVID